MAVDIKKALQDLTFEQLWEDFKAVGTQVGLPVSLFKLSPIRSFAETFCRWLLVPWNGQVLPALRAMFSLEDAEDVWLEFVAFTRYKVYKKRATFGSADLVVENREGGVWTINPGDVRFANAAGKTYSNTNTESLAAWTGSGPYPTVTLTFVADEAGSDSDVDVGEVPEFPDPPLAAPGAGIYLRTNAQPITAQDEESDEELRQACRDSTGPLSPAGPAAAYRFVATRARRPTPDKPITFDTLLIGEGEAAVNINRVHRVNVGGGVVNIYLASPDGAASGNVATAGSDVFLANQAIQLLVVPTGLTANVYPAVESPQTIALTMQIARSTTADPVAAAAAGLAAARALFRTYPIEGRTLDGVAGKWLVMDEVRDAAKDSYPGVIKVTSTPSADVSLPANSVVVPTITVSVVLVTQG